MRVTEYEERIYIHWNRPRLDALYIRNAIDNLTKTEVRERSEKNNKIVHRT